MSESEAKTPAEMYERVLVPAIFDRWAPLLLERASLRPGERVVDVACGTGIVARKAAPLVGEDGHVVGVDPNPEMLAVARSYGKPSGASITWHESDATALPDGPFDVVVCQQGLQFVADRAQALKEMRRVTAPSGRLAASVWKGLEMQPVFAALCEAEARHLDTSLEVVAGPPFSFGSADELRALVDAAGFGDIEIADVSHDVRFADPEKFVMLMALSAAAVIPHLAEMDDDAKQKMVEAVTDEMAPVLREYADGDELVFTMHANLVVAHA